MDGSERALSVPSLIRIVEDPFVGDEGWAEGDDESNSPGADTSPPDRERR